MADAFEKEETRKTEQMHHLAAWVSANIMNASGNLKKPVSVEKLLGKKGQRNRKIGETLSPEEKKRRLEALKAKFGR
jgi:hypothetical protein